MRLIELFLLGEIDPALFLLVLNAIAMMPPSKVPKERELYQLET